jgi:hypothetical protein
MAQFTCEHMSDESWQHGIESGTGFDTLLKGLTLCIRIFTQPAPVPMCYHLLISQRDLQLISIFLRRFYCYN